MAFMHSFAANTNHALPVITRVNISQTTGLVEVEYTINSKITALVSSFFLAYTYPTIDPQSQMITYVPIPLPPLAQGSVIVDRLLPSVMVRLILNSTIGEYTYISLPEIITTSNKTYIVSMVRKEATKCFKDFKLSSL